MLLRRVSVAYARICERDPLCMEDFAMTARTTTGILEVVRSSGKSRKGGAFLGSLITAHNGLAGLMVT